MRGSAFDRLIQALPAAISRRELTRLLTGLPLGPFVILVNGGSKGVARRKRERRPLSEAACIPTGKRCPSKKPRGKGKRLGCNRCCQDYTATAPGGGRICACRPSGTACGGNGASACCGGVCAEGICQGSSPSPPAPGCINHLDCGSNAICLPDGSCRVCTVTCPGTICDGAALQQALRKGGNVYVCPGRYVGTFRIEDHLDQALTVVGAGEGADPSENTILDASQAGSVLTIASGVTPTVTLQRLRVTGGALNVGAGIFHEGAKLIMRDCTVTGNTLADGFGGGVLSGNHATLEMTRCSVTSNFVTGANWYAAGIYTDGTTTLIDCFIAGNHATNDNSSGGGLFLFGGETVLRGSTVVRDNEAMSGGGIFISLGRLVVEQGSLVTMNTATAGAGSGGGIFNDGGTAVLEGDDPSPTVVNNCHENCTGSVPKCATLPVSC